MSEDVSPLRKVPKKGLGRGLESLLGEASSLSSMKIEDDVVVETKTTVAPKPMAVVPQAPAVPENMRIWNLAIENVTPNREQPRRHFDHAHLLELANSIKEKGILLPIVVRRSTEGKFEIIAGERRWRAAQLAGKKEVPAILRTSENQEALELALIENIQRQNLNPIEEAEAYQRLGEKYGLTQQTIADKVGKDRATIANLMRLVTLSPEVKNFVKAGEIQLGQAKVLLAISDKNLQLKIAKKVINLKLSVRATERIVAQALTPQGADLEIEGAGDVEREIQHLTSELQKLLGTKVKIENDQGRSKLSIQFYSISELNQFVDKLRKTAR
jgi:ParB family transcriptional regulator, chromosome partitioning protein